jgi:ABC-type molybdenum transport system ATPase subunit/photorepair protein PhrA
MLARAIVGQPRILVLDDLLDDLDTDARAEVLRALLRDDRAWTLVVFSRHAGAFAQIDRSIRLSGARGNGDGTAPNPRDFIEENPDESG